MGDERKEKKKSRKRSSSLSSTEDEGGRRKRQRSDKEEGDGRRSRKSDKKEKRKDKRSHRHHSDKEKKSKDKHKTKRHKGDRHLKPEFQLSNDDYFSKNNEFATWLKEKKKVFFSDLTSESARELFSVFVKDWNAQKLESRYYEGISSGPRSAHNWALKL
ncbi:style cell-cycle inhibitor 1-A [Populus nigra]|uniref:style cell-cycle inhibitor 1-A n=1 Tax=Populus nigra TaxID=3691 RepID=UPI002B267D88|nr:style cell-cycle inhibitor 1-A [Populus nigra]